MQVATALSANPIPAHATGEVLADLLERIGPAPTVVAVFVTPTFGGALDDIRAAFIEVLDPSMIVCAVSAGVLADGIEIIDRPAITAWAATGPSGALWFTADGTVGTSGTIDGSGAAYVLLDPSTTDPDARLDAIEARLPRHEIVGGILSAACGPSRIVAPDGAEVGSIAIVLDDAEASTVWGVAPIDEVRFAEIHDGSMVLRLDEFAALDVVVESIGVLDESDRTAVSRSLRLALLGPDEFGVVPVLGTDRSTGAIAIGGHASDGTLVQLLRGDEAGVRDSIIRTLMPIPGARLLATTGFGDRTTSDPSPGGLVAELSGGAAVGPVVAAVVSTTRSGPTLVDAPLVVVTSPRSPD